MKRCFARALVLLLGMLLATTVFAQADKDTDGDGMPDAWEKKYGLDPENPMDADLDIDGDKISNLDEFKKGTDPTDGKDRNGNGLPDDWCIFYFGKADIDPKADPDNDGYTNLQEFENGTNPTVSDKKAEARAAFVRPTPSMDGVRATGDESHKHVIGPSQVVFLDPQGDDKGPGYYTYPTNPVYVKGGFDILKVEIDGSAKDNVVFKITVNADLKQEWGMAADFDVQHFQIYIDTDGVPGSGNVATIPGLNLFIDPEHAWDRVILITPQPNSRVEIEVEAKAKEFEDSVVVPRKIIGQGRTIIATVLKKDLGMRPDDDITKWKYQVFAQSNEGFPDREDVLTRNVNEYNGLHRFGGGSDYWGDPEVMDILAFPAKGTVEEAKRQFDILNVWESFPDPMLDIRAVVPMVWAGQEAPKDVAGLAEELAVKMRPKPAGDKYVSGNFDLFGKVFTRWNWNMNPGMENFFKNSLEMGIDGKVFTDKIDFYLRFEQAKWDNTIWNTWNNDTPGQEAIALQSSKLVLVNLIPTVDAFTIGNYEVNYSPWVMGGAWYPDRDKYKGFFFDGRIEGLLNYKAAMFYPLWWLAIDGTRGANKDLDFTYVVKADSKSLVQNLDVGLTYVLFTDFEVHPFLSNPSKYVVRSMAPGVHAYADYKLPFFGLSVGAVLAWSSVSLDEGFKKLEVDGVIDIDGNGVLGGMQGSNNNKDVDTSGLAYVLNVKANNFMDLGFNFHVQHFNISDDFVAPGAARGDTAFGGGSFGASSTAGTADVLAMIGNQSAHRAPQAADFTSSIPIPTLPTFFLIPDPQLGTSPIGWVNDNWEGVAAAGWKGLTTIVQYAADVWRAHAEISFVSFNEPTLELYSRTRAYAAGGYTFLGIGRGLTTTLSFMYESTGNEKASYQVIPGVGGQWQAGSSTYMSPWVTIDYNWAKNFNTTLGLRFEFGNYDDGNTTTEDISYGRQRLIFTFTLNTPLGFIKTRSEIWMENEDAVNFPTRATHGAYAVTEWEYAF